MESQEVREEGEQTHTQESLPELVDDFSDLRHYVLNLEENESHENLQCGAGRFEDPPLTDVNGYLVPLKGKAKSRKKKRTINRGGDVKRKSQSSKTQKGAGRKKGKKKKRTKKGKKSKK